MRKEITKEVLICDRCKREITNSLNYHCSVCQKEICGNCRDNSPFDAYPDICRDCAKIPTVKTMREDYIDQLREMTNNEIKKLSNLTPQIGDYVRGKGTHCIGTLLRYCDTDGLIEVEHHPKGVASGPLIHDLKDWETITKEEFEKELE